MQVCDKTNRIFKHATLCYRAFSDDVTAALLLFQNNDTAAMMVY